MNDTTDNPMKQIKKSYQHAIICLLLAATSLVIYWNVGNYEFINFDDNSYVWNNPYVKQGLTLNNIQWAFNLSGNSEDQNYWHPLAWISHMIDCQLFGLDAGKHHLVNLSIHILNSLLLYIVFFHMTGAMWQSAFVAALFSAHPLNVDSVAWIAERKNLLSTLFWLMTMLAYVYYSRRPSIYRYILVFTVMAAGLLAKPMLVTLPCVLLLLDFWPLGRLRLPFSGQETAGVKPFHGSTPVHLIAEKIPLLVLSLFSIIASMVSLQNQNQIVSEHIAPMSLRVENAIVSYVKYIAKIAWPTDMTIYYPFPEAIPLWQVTGALILLAAAFGAVFFSLRKAPYLSIGWLWFIGTLSPIIGIVQGGLWPEMADRWTYVPAIGLFVMTSWGGAAIVKKYSIKPAIAAILAFFILIPFILIAKNQTSHWQNSITLFSHSLEAGEDNEVARYNLGEGLGKKEKFDEAIIQYIEALKINPRLAKAHNNIGRILADKEQTDEAITRFRQALAIDPSLIEAHMNLGRALGNKGLTDESLAQFALALKIDPDKSEIYEDMGKAVAKKKLFDQAIDYFNHAIKMNPRSANAINGLGNAFAEKGDLDEAINKFHAVLKIDPDYKEVHNNLANALVRKGKLDEALYHYESIISDDRKENITVKNRDALLSFLKPGEQVNILFKTAVRFAGEKNYDKAVALFRKILSITPNNSIIYYNISCLYAIQNKKTEALDWLRQAVDHGYDNWEKLKTDPDMHNIKETPYFRSLVEM